MPFPAGTPVVTLTGTLPAAVADTGYGGQIILTPSALLTDPARHAIYPGGGTVTITDGAFTTQLIPNNAPGIAPDGWRWHVDLQPANGRRATFWTDIHGSDGATIHLADLVPAQAPDGASSGGQRGLSAYEIAVQEGFDGTVTEWLASLVGPPGANGLTRGGITLTTDGPPSSGLGIDGDWALDTATRRLYGPKSAGAWPSFSVVPGPTATGWTHNGLSAVAGSDVYLTHAGDGFGAGSTWYGTPQPSDGLDVTFEAEMSGGSGADGIAFALADAATLSTFVGGGGGDLGLVGCSAVALALDTGSGSRARIVTTDDDSMTAVATYGGALSLRPAPVTVRVRYAAGALSAWINGTQIFNAVPVAAPATARLGWTGANGGLTDDHIIRSVAFTARGGIQL